MPEVVQAVVVSSAPGSASSNAAPMGTVVADGKASGQARIVTATVLQQPVMGQMVVGQPVVGGIPPSPYGGAYGDAYGGPYRGASGGAYGGAYAGAYGGVVAGGAPAEDPTFLAIIACFCCCWCIGIVAIIKAQQVNQANMTGNFMEAHQLRKEAMQWVYATIGVGMVLQVLQLVVSVSMKS
mmetsp:Transcript_94818/g.156582  ORF Transcript_94818/g.156582 Transcript_94818/m.156582 type:complete len:182 (-) Transcript_94818:103-648(-)